MCICWVTVYTISLLHGYRAHTATVCSESHTERTVFCPGSDRLPYGPHLAATEQLTPETHDPTINLWRHAESLFLIVNNDTRPHDAADKHRNSIFLWRGTAEGGGGFVRIRRRCDWHVTIWLRCLWCGALRLGRKVLSFRMNLFLLSSWWKTCRRTKTEAATSFYNTNMNTCVRQWSSASTHS